MGGFLNMLKEDVEVVFDQDPAARSKLEVILTYSGLHAIWGSSHCTCML